MKDLDEFLAETLSAARTAESPDLLDRSTAPRSTLGTLSAGQLLWEETQNMVLLVSPGGLVLEANPAAERAYGYARSELIGRPFLDLAGDTPGTAHVGEPGKRVVYQATHRRRNGLGFPVEVTTSAAEVDGQAVQLYIITDITRRRRMAATQSLLREIDQAILQRLPLEVILSHVCERLVSLFGVKLAFIGMREPDGAVRVYARAGAGSSELESLRIRWDETDEGRGPTGTAIRTAHMQIFQFPDDALQPWRGQWEALGFKAALSIPLLTRHEAFGALTVCTSVPISIDDDLVGHFHHFADQISISLAAAQDQAQIHLQTVALEAAANAVIITDRKGRIIWVNSAFSRLTGYAREEVIGQSPALLKSGTHNPAAYKRLWDTILAGEIWHGELYNRRKDGTLYLDEQTITPVRDEFGQITHFIGIKQDGTDRKRQEEQLRHQAMHDPVTELPNRRALREELKSLLERSQWSRRGALVLMDLDNFKLVNDTCGHAAGDQVLIHVSALFRRALRPSDFLARLGGDEFAVVLEDVSLADASVVAERLRKAACDCRFNPDGRNFTLGVSIGIAPIDGTLDLDAVMALADSALYAAKDLGKNQTVVYQNEDEKGMALIQAAEWATRLTDALREGRLTLYFQPVVRLDTGEVEHLEALLRLQDEQGKIISPGAFLSAAEDYGLMPEIDRWVIDQVIAVLQRHPDLRVFVNISGESLGHKGLLQWIEESIRSSGLAPGRLSFEVTETTAVGDLQLAQEWMGRLKELGCSFALDDFGIGFSSFGYLRTLPADYVKIDGSFIRNLDSDPTNLALVQAINNVAHALGKKVVAEWVENEVVAQLLQKIGVEHGQGYYWGQPGPERTRFS